MHLGITGTRNGMTEPQFNLIKELLENHSNITHLDEGDCIGVDAEMVQICQDMFGPGIEIVRHPPINKKYQAFAYYDTTWEAKKYLTRNADIVNECRELWACPKGPEIVRSGTWACVRYAKKVGKPTIIIMPNGSLN